MNETKGALQSKTVWASILTVLLQVAQVFLPEAVAPLTELGSALSSLFAIYGRITATSVITGVITPSPKMPGHN